MADSGAYIKLPVAVVLDPRLTADGLAIVAYRATYVGKFTLHRTHLKRIFGIGDNRFSAAIANAQTAGYLDRRRARDGTKEHGRTVESLNLPDAPTSYVFMRRSDMETLGLRALAAFLFVAARPTGQHAYGRELSERFGWAPSTSMKWLAELLTAELIVRLQRKNSLGQMDGCVYAVTENRAARPDFEKAKQSNTTPLDKPKSKPNGAYGGLSDWLASTACRDGQAAQTWSQAIHAVKQDERLAHIDPTVVRQDLETATAHRIAPALLTTEGLLAYSWLVCALSDITDSDIRIAHENLLGVLALKIGQKPTAHISSWVYLIKTMFRSLSVTDGEALPSAGSVRLLQIHR
jgi:hypothetical protein